MHKAVVLFVFLLAGCFWGHAAWAADAKKPVIVLDPGHSPPTGGALSIRGVYEVEYNDRFAAGLAIALQKAGFHVVLTRQPDQAASLQERSALANRLKPDLFLALHHDSAQLVHLEPLHVNGVATYRTKEEIAGYSLFVSRENAQFNRSWLFAQQLGKNLLSLGRPPTLHHAEHIAGENRELLDKKLGIYRFDRLAVLRKTEAPAVLLELGVIVDQDDDAYVSNPTNQETMIQAIVTAIKTTVKK